MRFLILFVLVFLGTFSSSQKLNPQFDSSLAVTYGADDYGMKWYTLVLLKTGTVKIEDKRTVDSLFAGHLQNIIRLADEGKLVVAGPLAKNEKYRGIFILTVNTPEQAQEILQTDPAIREKLLDADIFRWYGSAALPQYLETSKKLGKYGF